jgi:hypothetical protein
MGRLADPGVQRHRDRPRSMRVRDVGRRGRHRAAIGLALNGVPSVQLNVPANGNSRVIDRQAKLKQIEPQPLGREDEVIRDQSRASTPPCTRSTST